MADSTIVQPEVPGMAGYVSKIRVAVRLAVGGLPPMEGFLSLESGTRNHARPETILEKLNSSARVIPFHRGADNAVLLVNRMEIEYVGAGDDVTMDYVMPPAYRVTLQERVRLRLTSGVELRGVLRLELPDDLNRVSDYLNTGDDYFPLALPGEVLLVNKNHVSVARLFDASPAPVTELPLSESR